MLYSLESFRMTLSDLEKYSVTRSIVRGLSATAELLSNCGLVRNLKAYV